jgi:DNA end-binding protein Ku
MPATVWKGYLSFGLVSFPVRLFAAARPEAIHFHMLHKKDLSRIKEVWYCAEENKPIERADIVKGYEYTKGEYVVVEADELKKIAPPTASTMDILQFVREDEVDPIFLESSYYLAPEEAVSKPYVLLLKAMTDTKHFAVAKVTMHGREHVAVIRPTDDGMVLHTLYYVNELHKANAAGRKAKSQFNAKEVQLAKSLISSLAAPFKPDVFHDQYRENVERLIEQKKKGQKITLVKQPKAAPVADILAALQQSLKESAKAAPKKTTKKRARAA